MGRPDGPVRSASCSIQFTGKGVGVGHETVQGPGPVVWQSVLMSGKASEDENAVPPEDRRFVNLLGKAGPSSVFSYYWPNKYLGAEDEGEGEDLG